MLLNATNGAHTGIKPETFYIHSKNHIPRSMSLHFLNIQWIIFTLDLVHNTTQISLGNLASYHVVGWKDQRGQFRRRQSKEKLWKIWLKIRHDR